MLLASSQHKRLPQGLCGPFYELKQLQQGFTIGGMGSDRHFARQQSSGPNVRFGSKADICSAAKERLFDHLVGNRQHARWNCESERSRRAEVDCKLQFGGLQNWQVCQFCPFENPSRVVPHTSISIRDATGITHQAADRDEFTVWMNCRNPVPCR